MDELRFPRPWKAVFDKERRILTVDGKDGWTIAFVEWDAAYGYEEPDSSDWEVAHLLAAAPELLEALEFFVAAGGGAIYCVEGEELQDCVDKARAAIAKAKGEDQ